MTYYWIWPIICRLTWHFDHNSLCWLLQVFKWNSQHNKINLVFCFSHFICISYLVPIITYWSVSTSLFKITTLQHPEHHILFESSNTYESKNMELFTRPFLLFTNNNIHVSKCKQISIHNISWWKENNLLFPYITSLIHSHCFIS